MPNSDQDARSDMPCEPEPVPPAPSPAARTSLHQTTAAQDLASSAAAANDADPSPSRAKPARRRKLAELPDADAALLPAADAQDAAPAPPRAAAKRRTSRTVAATPDSPAGQPEPVDTPPDATLPGAADATLTDASITDASTTDASTTDASSGQPAAAISPEAVPPDPAATPDAAAPDAPQPAAPDPRAAEPEQKAAAAGPARPLTITASDAALAVINPHPIRANDRPDGYLYHLTSPNEAKVLMQSGLPCSFDDPIILTERGGIPYWLSVLSEDFDDILDGPASVTVLRIRRRAVQNAIESDADSTRAAQVPCYLLTGVSGLPPVPAPPPPPLLRARPPAPAFTPAPAVDGAAEPGSAVEMGGTVKWYNPRKGFGFITPGSGGKDVFVHASTLERAGLAQLTDGQSVRMQVIQGAKGPEAASLSLA